MLWGLGTAHKMAQYELCQIKPSSKLLETQGAYQKTMHLAQQYIDQGNIIPALKAVRHARSLPGYKNIPESLKKWGELYQHIPKKAFQGVQKILDCPVSSFKYASADLKYILDESESQFILYDMVSGDCLQKRFYTDLEPDARDPVYCEAASTLVLSSDAQTVFWGSKDFFGPKSSLGYRIKKQVLSQKKYSGLYEGHDDEILSLYLDATYSWLLSGSADHTMRLWGVKNYRCLRIFRGHQFAVNSVILSKDGRLAISGSSDRTVRVWQIDTGRCLRVLEGHNAGVTAIALSHDGRYLLSGSRDGTLRLWLVETGECKRMI